MASNPSRPGYRFRPTDGELLNHFLPSKINGDDEAVREIPELDICKFEPWQLPAQSPIETIDDEWFFFYPMNRKYKRGDRLKRATEKGFWKSTGPDRQIKSEGTVIGTKRTLVFHIGRSPKGRKTDWYMHEYRSVSEQGSLLLCKLIKKADKKLDGRQDEKNIVETADVSSSAIITPSAEDMQSEPVTPMISAQPKKLLSTSASYLAENTDEKIPDADEENQVLNFGEVEKNVYSSGKVKPFAEDMQSEPLTPMMNPQAEKIASTSASCLPENYNARTLEDHSYSADGAGDISPDPELEAILGQMIEHPDCKIFYQSPKEMEVGSSYNYPVANNMDPDHEVQEGADGQDIEEFLNSILSDDGMNVAVESEAPSSESYAEVGQEQNNGRAPARMDMPVGANRTNDITTEEHFSGQHSVAIASTSNQLYDLFNSPLESGCFGNADGNSDISATGNSDISAAGIRLRTRQSHSQPSGRYTGLQGSAPRRIRLQMDLQVGSFYSRNSRDLRFEDENHGAKPITAKAEEAEEKHSMPVGPDASKDENIDASLSKANNVTEVAEELGLDFKSRSDFPMGDEKETLPVSLKAISALHWFRYNILGVLLVIVGLSIVFEGIWMR